MQPRINAFALPTREIVVYTGLIDLLEDDTLLSAVLAHEISHVVQRHAVENVSLSYTAIQVITDHNSFSGWRRFSYRDHREMNSLLYHDSSSM